MANISIIGSGYVGLSAGVGFALLGHNVVLVDVDKDKVDKINSGTLPIYDDSFKKVKKPINNLVRATTDYRSVLNTDVTFVCVGTPPNQDGSTNLSYIKEVSSKLGSMLKEKNEKHVLVIKSTVPPGTTENFVREILEQEMGESSSKIGFAMVPEFLREGHALDDFLHPDRIVIGTNDDWVKEKLKEIHKGINAPTLFVSPTTAEMIKYTSNAFLATKISFANEIGNICKKLGIDSHEVFKGVGMDHRISPYFFGSGLGFGGSCFPKDVKSLIHTEQRLGEEPKILRSTLEINDKQPQKFVELIEKHAKPGETIGILGLAFKPGTDDIRESRAIVVVRLLLEKGYNVIAYDPKAMENVRKSGLGIELVESASEVLQKTKIIGVTTEWPEFRKLNYTDKIVIDGRNVREAKKTASVYEGVCW